MGLINTRNLSKAKLLLDKNRHKVGDMVGKATEQIDKVSKGKTSGVSAKVEEAARKYSAGAVTSEGVHPDAAGAPTSPASSEPLDDGELQRRQADANIAAANAMKAAADAAATLMNTAAAQAERTAGPAASSPGGDGDDETRRPSGGAG